MGHVRKRGASWQARYRAGDGRERVRTFARKVDAERWIATETAAQVEGRWVDPRSARTTLGDFAEAWMAAQPWRASTRDRQTSVYRCHIAPTFAHRPLGSLRPSELQAWATGLERAPSTVEGVVGLLRTILAAAVTDRLIASSPAGGLKLQRGDGRHTVPLTVDEVRRLAGAAPVELEAAVIFAAATGLRQGELFGVTGDRVVWLRREVVIDRQLVTPSSGPPALGPCKTARSVRTVPVADHAVEALARHVERFGPGDGGFVFHHAGGRPWRRNTAAAAFGRLAARAGVEASGWHALRHHAASVLIAQGLGVAAVAATLGHSPAECLKTYAGWWPSESEQVRAAVSRAWADPAAVTPRSRGESP
jgi:integrase